MIVAALFAAEIASAFQLSAIYAGFAALIRALGDPLMAGWLVTTHMLIGAGACAIAARGGDIYGRRRITLLLLVAAAVGSLISATSSNFPMLLIGQGLQGLSAAVLPLSFGILREWLPRERVPFNIGMLISSAGIGTAAGLVGGGMIVDYFSWRWMYAAGGVLALAALVMCLTLVPRDHAINRHAQVDWIGGLLFLPAIGALLLGISKMKDWGPADPRVLGAIAAGVAIMALWVRQSLRSSHPFIDVRLLAQREVAIVNTVSVLIALGTLQITLVFSLMLQSPLWTGIGLGLSATAAGLVKLPSNILSITAGPLSGWLAARVSGRLPMMIGGIMATAGWIGAIFLNGSPAIVALVLCVISFGTTLLFAAVPTIIIAVVPSERTSEATGMMQVMRTAFMAVGAQIVALVLSLDTVRNGAGGAAFPSPLAVKAVMAVIAALTLAATLLILLLPTRRAIAPLPR